MPKIVLVNFIPIGGRRAVRVWLEEDGSGHIQFITPIKREDIKDRAAVPRASAERQKTQLLTHVSLSKEGLRALQELLNEVLA